MPDDETFVSSGSKPIADRLYKRAGMSPQDIDVALIYDHFTPMRLMQLEDYGFCAKGEGGPFVQSGAIRYTPERRPGAVPVNTHGGQLSEAYVIGATHIMEGVEQLRGTAVNQVAGAELADVTDDYREAGDGPPGRRRQDHHRSEHRAVLAGRRGSPPGRPRCAECGRFRLPPTPFCPHCQSTAVIWGRRGTVRDGW